MTDMRPQADRILVAELTGEARHRAKWRPLTGNEEAPAVAELRKLAGGRADLLAEVAGIFEGTSEGELDEPLARRASDVRTGRGRTRGDTRVDRRGAAPGGGRPSASALRRREVSANSCAFRMARPGRLRGGAPIPC